MPSSLSRARAAKCAACLWRTSGAAPLSSSRAAAKLRSVSSMPNRLCSCPGVTTSQDESTSPRITGASAAGVLSLVTARASATVNVPANTLSSGTSS